MQSEAPRTRAALVVLVLAVGSLALLLPHSPAAAQPRLQAVAEPGSEAPPAPRRGPTDPAEIEAFMDGLMRAHLADANVAGATVAVVRDGELLFSKGYGWADVERRIPVDPGTTLFPIGSVTKLFTWTAVMQLRDAGRLDLDADVNDYLDFRIPATFSQPITLRHLMTHTPGFEAVARKFLRTTRNEQMARGEWLRRNIPARVRPPGQEVAYSNYGAVLAGYVVERVSGMPWEEYVEQRILQPLGMTAATVRQPLPEALAPQMSQGYVYRNGGFVADAPGRMVSPARPTGSISASAEAMAPFMIAFLQGGRYGDARILADSSAREMQARAFGSDPRINGWGLGFEEKSSHGLRIIGHAGATPRFLTNLVLIPSEQLGVFVSYNSPGARALVTGGFMDAFLDRYYPSAPLVVSEPASGWEERVRAYAGSYAALRRPYTNMEKLAGSMGATRVTAAEPGVILLRTGSRTERLFEVEPGYFRSSDGAQAAAFRTRPRGATHLYISSNPASALERVSVPHGMGLHAMLFATSLLLFVSMLVVVPARFALQRRVAGIEPLRGAERALRWAAIAFTAVSLALIASIMVAMGDLEAYLAGDAELFVRGALTLALLSLPLAGAIVVGAVLAFRRGYWSRWGRIHYAFFTAAVVVFLLQLHYWNLLGWKL